MGSKKVLDSEAVLHLAKLANLRLKKEEAEKFRYQLSDIFEFISQLQRINTDKVIPTFAVTHTSSKLRKDRTIKSLRREDALKNAPNKENNYFKTKKVFDEVPRLASRDAESSPLSRGAEIPPKSRNGGTKEDK